MNPSFSITLIDLLEKPNITMTRNQLTISAQLSRHFEPPDGELMVIRFTPITAGK